MSRLEDELRQEVLDKNKLEVKEVNGEKVFEMTKSEVNRMQGQSYMTGIRAGKEQAREQIKEEAKKRILGGFLVTATGASIPAEMQELGKFIYWLEGLKFDD